MQFRHRIGRAVLAVAGVAALVVLAPAPSTGALTIGTTQTFTVNTIGHDGIALGVSCVPAVGSTPAGCVAVGTNEGTQHPLVITSDGTTHVASYADALGGRHNLEDVYCSTSARCVAVGWGDTVSTSGRPYIMELDNGVWTAVTVATTDNDNTGQARLRDLTCVDIDNCVAVGSYRRQSNGKFVAFAATKVAGTWSTQEIVSADSVSGGGQWWMGDRVETVACPSSTACIAVGTGFNGAAKPIPLIATGTLSGGTWTWTTSLPALPQMTESGSGVVNCSTDGYCMVVGRYTASSAPTERNYALVYSAGAWDPTTIFFDSAGAAMTVADVSCPTSGICYAVGSIVNATVAEFVDGVATFVDLDNGSNWSDANEIECPSMNSCAVLGTAGTPQGNMYIATRENGVWVIPSTYAVVVTDPASAYDSYPQSLSCRSDGFCMAGGQHRQTNVWWRASVTPFTFPVDPATRGATNGGGSGSGDGSTVIPPAYTG